MPEMAKTAGPATVGDVNAALSGHEQAKRGSAATGEGADETSDPSLVPIRRDFVVPRSATRDSSQEAESDEAAQQAHLIETALSYTSSPSSILNTTEAIRPQHSRSRTSPARRRSSSPSKSASSSVSSYLLDDGIQQDTSESSDGGSSPVIHTIPGNRSSTGNIYKKPIPASMLQATRPGYKRQRTNSHPTFLLRTTTAPSGSRSPSRTNTPVNRTPTKRLSHPTRSHSASLPNGRIRSDSKPPSPFPHDGQESPRFANALQRSPEEENGPIDNQKSSSSETFSAPKPRKRRKSPDRTASRPEQEGIDLIEPEPSSPSSDQGTRRSSPKRKRAVRKSISEPAQTSDTPVETDAAALRGLLAQVDIASALELVKSVQQQQQQQNDQTHIPRPASMRFPKSEEVTSHDFEHEKRERRFSIHRNKTKSVSKDSAGMSRSHSVAGFLGLGKGKGKEKEEEARTGELRAFEESIHRVYLTLSPATVTRADNARANLEERYAPVYHAIEEHEPIPSLLNVARWRQRRTSSERSMRRMSLDQSSSRSGDHGMFTKATALLHRSDTVYSNAHNSDASSMQSFPLQDSTRSLLKKSSNRSDLPGQAWNIQPQELTEFLVADDKEEDDDSSIKERPIDNPSILMPAAHIQPQMKRSGSLRSVASRSSAAKSTGTSPPTASRLKSSPRKPFEDSPNRKLNNSVSPAALEPTPESPDPEEPNHTITNRGRKRVVSTPAHSDTESHTPRFAPHTKKRRESTSTIEVWSPETSDAEGPRRRNSQLNGPKFASRLRSSPKPTVDGADSTKGTDHEDNHRRSGFGAALASLTSMHDSGPGRKLHHHHHSRHEAPSSLRSSQLASADKAPDQFADQLPWSMILGLDISGPVFPERSRPDYTAGDDDTTDMRQKDELVSAMSDFLHRADRSTPEAPPKIRRYLDQLHNHTVNTKILSRSTVECQLEMPKIHGRIKKEIDCLPHDIDTARYQEHEPIHTDEEELDHHSDDEIAAPKLPKGSHRHPKSASLDSSVLSKSSQGQPPARRRTLASSSAPKADADQSLVDPLPGLEHIISEFEGACNDGKSRLFEHHAVQADLKERILDLMEKANSIQEYNDQTIEPTLGSLEEMLLKVRPVVNNKSRSMDFCWTLCAAALSSVFWVIRLLASLISTCTHHPFVISFLLVGATVYAFTDITL